MAEVVGLVVGVVSLGVQLAESTQKAKRFYNAVKDAPGRLADIIDEIESLSDILIELEGDRNRYDADVGPKMQRCVATCRKAVDKFAAYADGLESRMQRHRLRGRAKFAVKSESIEEVISRLESSKSNLVLAYMLYREAVADKRATEMRQQIDNVAVGQALLLAQASSVPNSTNTTRNQLVMMPSARGKTIAHLRTPLWLSRTVWEVAVSQAISGWTLSLRSRRIVPSGSPVVQACRDGDSELLRQLFDRREASPFDEVDHGDIYPCTLFTVAMSSSSITTSSKVTRLIISASGGTMFFTPGMVARSWGANRLKRYLEFDLSTLRECCRFLLEHCDIDLMSDTGYSVVAPHNRRYLDQMQIFVSGSTEDGNIVFFLNEIQKLSLPWYIAFGPMRDFGMEERALSSLLNALTLNGEIKYLAGPRTMQLVDPLAHEPAHALASMYVASVFRGSTQGASNARTLKELIAEALKHGLNLHRQAIDGKSPLLDLYHDEDAIFQHAISPSEVDDQVNRSYTNMENILHIWLDLLISIDVDLTSYGWEEWRLFQRMRHKSECDQPWEKSHTCAACGHYDDYGNWYSSARPCSTLLAFSYGAAISDWKLWVTHRGDDYAGQFWRMVERDGLGMEGADHCTQYMPGGWIEEVEQ